MVCATPLTWIVVVELQFAPASAEPWSINEMRRAAMRIRVYPMLSARVFNVHCAAAMNGSMWRFRPHAAEVASQHSAKKAPPYRIGEGAAGELSRTWSSNRVPSQLRQLLPSSNSHNPRVTPSFAQIQHSPENSRDHRKRKAELQSWIPAGKP
jgi:hypothetical protein